LKEKDGSSLHERQEPTITEAMRIGFDGTPLLGQRAGIGNYTAHLLAALLRTQPEYEYLLYSNRPLGELEPALRAAGRVYGYLPQSRWLWMQLMLPRLVAYTRPDLCHYTNASAPLRQRHPFVITIHDASLFLYSQYHPRSRLLAIRALLPVLARRAAAVITVSEHARADLSRTLQLSADKIHVVYEAPAPHFQPITDEARLESLRRAYYLPENFIFYLGALEPRKNLYRLVQAVGQLRRHGCDIRLVLAGPTGWQMHGFQQLIMRQGLETAVQYLGYVPDSDLPGLYSLATIFAFPSLYEGFGLPPLEAMACGAPVLTSRASAMAEVCGDAACLVDPYSVEAISDGLRQLLADPEWRTELGRRGRLRARLFSWDRAAHETTAVYQLAAGAGQPVADYR
jgi:glycosyltransferase involved in cell wall biosynthesis